MKLLLENWRDVNPCWGGYKKVGMKKLDIKEYEC
jgi:hypothetical protein